MDRYTELLVKGNEDVGIRCDSCRNVFSLKLKTFSVGTGI